MAGARSIAVCSSLAKVRQCQEIGAFEGITTMIPNYEERVNLITDNKGVDVIMDPILGSFFKNNIDCLAYDSRWVIYGSLGGLNIQNVNMGRLLNKRANILSSTLRNRTDEYKTQLIRDFARDILPAFETGQLKPIIDSIYPLSQASDALFRMKQNLNVGKIVLVNDL